MVDSCNWYHLRLGSGRILILKGIRRTNNWTEVETRIQGVSIYPAFSVSTRERLGGSALFSILTVKQIKLPVEVILRLVKFLRFEDFYNFVRALWPSMNECGQTQTAMRSSSDRYFTATFINGKTLEIRYNFNRHRDMQNRILVNRNTLLPIFGGIILPTMNEYVSMSELCNFVKTHVHLNECSNYQYVSCPCHLPNYDGQPRKSMMNHFTAGGNCRHGHFHHYCRDHVLYWLQFYLGRTLSLRVNGLDKLYAQDAENFLMCLNTSIYFQKNRKIQFVRYWRVLCYLINEIVCNTIKSNKQMFAIPVYFYFPSYESFTVECQETTRVGKRAF